MKQRFVVLDLETTGNSPKKQDKIIQVGAVLIEDGEIVERFASFVNPECTIPPFIEQLTNINTNMVKKAPTFKQIAPMLSEMLEGSSLVAHNVPFDLSFLQHELKLSGQPIFTGNTVDTVELARILLPTIKGYKLTDLATYYGLAHDNPHRADSDAEVTAIIFLKLVEKIKRLPLPTVKQLHHLLHTMKSDIYMLFQNGEAEISPEHTMYHDKLVLKANKEVDPATLQKVSKELVQKLSKQSKSSALYMEVKALFEARQHGLLELAQPSGYRGDYTLAALVFAIDKNKKVVISSLSSGAKKEIKARVESLLPNSSYLIGEMKGKYFYLSLSRFLSLLAEEEDNYDAVLTKAQILVWLTETETGDVEELSLSSGGRLLWDSINCSIEGESNQDDHCFYTRSLKSVKEAPLILTNHSFLAKEIWKPQAFKELDYYIVDDADLFSQQVSRFLGKEVSYLDFYFALSKLNEHSIVHQAKEELDDTFRILRSYCLARVKNKQHRALYRYDVIKEKSPGWFAVQEAAQRLYMKLTDVLLMLEKQHSSEADEMNEGTWKHKQSRLEESKLLKTMRDTFYSLLFEPRRNGLTWLDVNTRGARNSVTIFEQPLNISSSLGEKFYQQKSSVLFLSPAFSVENSFEYSMEELGLTDFYPKTLTLGANATSSEFAGVYIPTDMPLLSRGKNESFIQIASLQLNELLNEKGGRILVTFSSLDMLSAVYNELKSLPDAKHTMVVSQSGISGGKQKILKAAANFENAILLVTNSFLEEVSITKERIDSLVIIRLPFKAMDDPIMAAKIDEVEKKGRNSFTDVSLPIAVLRFKKMVHTFLLADGPKDIFIFDRRVVDKRYGQTFIEAIPNAIVKKAAFFSILNSMK